MTSWRAETGSGYDGGALYDRSAVDPGDRTLRWTLRKNDGVDYNESDPPLFTIPAKWCGKW